jgi:hypothetical protein
MTSYVVAIKQSRERVWLVLTQGEDELLRACLPPPTTLWSCRPARALLESLAVWLDVRLHVAWCVAEPADGWSLDLTDDLGTELHTMFFDVERIERKRRRPARLRGVGDFRDVHQLRLLPPGDGR